MAESWKELMGRRRSVRTFDGRALTGPDRRALEEYTASLQNPLGVPVTFRVLNAGEYGLTSPVIVGAGEYLAAKVKREPHFELAVGYEFEMACLFALSRGIGTVMLAASLNRAAFEKAMAVGENEVLPVASPLGYPAAKKSVRETLMRKALKADERKSFESLFFRGSFDRALRPEEAGIFGPALEAARWAPSAANGQPWRAVLAGDAVHFYEARSMKDSPLGDIQTLDVGIALAHFHRALEEDGGTGSFVFADPGLAAPERTRYMVTFRREG